MNKPWQEFSTLKDNVQAEHLSLSFQSQHLSLIVLIVEQHFIIITNSFRNVFFNSPPQNYWYCLITPRSGRVKLLSVGWDILDPVEVWNTTNTTVVVALSFTQ